MEECEGNIKGVVGPTLNPGVTLTSHSSFTKLPKVLSHENVNISGLALWIY